MLPYNLTTPPPVAAMFLRAPVRMPSPRQMIEAEANRLIEVLDTLEPDPDLEDDDADEESDFGEDGGDMECNLCGISVGMPSGPGGIDEFDESEKEDSLGSLAGSGGSQLLWSGGCLGDLEFDRSDYEPSLGSIGSTYGGERHGLDGGGQAFRPADQTRWASGGSDDHELDAGDQPEEENEHGGDIQDEPHDAETDKGAEEDEGPLGYRASYDPELEPRAIEARRQIAAIRAKVFPERGNLRLL